MDSKFKKINELPKSPGVYHFLDSEGGVLYVGKAKNLKNRVKQYFLKELNRGPAIVQMVEMAVDIKWIETESEIEALLLEAELVNKLKPKYNIRLKDDKSFLVIKITKKNQNAKCKMQNIGGHFVPGLNYNYPCVELVRFKNVDLKDKNAYYFGPYPAGLLLKKSMRYLRKIFPFRDCSKTKFNTYVKKNRCCVYGDIGVCSGPCQGGLTEKEYEKNLLLLRNFLRGRKKEIIKSLEKEMQAFAKKQLFEKAAEVRNKLNGLYHLKDVAIGLRDDVFNGNNTLFKRIECYDISNISGEFAVGSMVVFTEGKADKDEYRKFRVALLRPLSYAGEESGKLKVENGESIIKNCTTPTPLLAKEGNDGQGESDLSRLKEVLERRFARSDWPMPDLVVIDGGEMHLRVAVEVLKNADLKIPSVSISKGPRRLKNDFHYSGSDIAKIFSGNIELQNVCIASRDEAHRFAISYYRTLHSKEMLK